MATHFSILAWKIPGTEESGRLQSMGCHRISYWNPKRAIAVSRGCLGDATADKPCPAAVNQGSKYSFPGGSDGKASACNVGDPGSIPGLGRSPGEGNGNPLQYSCLENPMDGGTL